MARGVPQNLRTNSKALRSTSTDAELRIWFNLRNRSLAGTKFRRQHPLAPYIVDFYCAERALVIEIDGSQHFEPNHTERDEQRTAYLEGLGLRVLRFNNRQVLTETKSVLEMILEALGAPSP